MATRSTIGYVDPQTGIVYSQYCHNDGYPEGVGATLLKSFKTLAKVKKLVALGALSSLDDKITRPKGHSFDNRIDGYTVAYHRDRGEELWEPRTAPTIAQFLATDKGEEYDYFFVDGHWLCSDHGKTPVAL